MLAWLHHGYRDGRDVNRAVLQGTAALAPARRVFTTHVVSGDPWPHLTETACARQRARRTPGMLGCQIERP